MSQNVSGNYTYTNYNTAQISTQQKTKIEQELQELGIPAEVIKQGPTAIKQYAEQNSITLPEPPNQNQPQGSIFDNNNQNADGSQDGTYA